jgi:hypothetical protein
MNWMTMSTLPVVMFGIRAAGSCFTNSTLVASSNRPRDRMRATAMSIPVSWPLSSSKCHGALVEPVPTISLPRPSTVRSVLAGAGLRRRLLRVQRGAGERRGARGGGDAQPAEPEEIAPRAGAGVRSSAHPILPLGRPGIAGRVRPDGMMRPRARARQAGGPRQRAAASQGCAVLCLAS